MTTAEVRSRALVRGALIALACAVAGLGLVTARYVYAGESALALAEQAFDRGELRDSVAAARRAAGFAVPGAPHVDGAYRRLVVIAQGAEALGRTDLARLAWEAVRAAALSTDGLGAAPRPELARANQSLARLGAAASEPASERAARERELSRRLAEPPGPGRIWLAVLGSGFALGAAGLALAALRGFAPGTGAVRRELWIGLAVFAIGAACWTLGVYQA